VGVFDEALRARDNHRADCIRTLDVAVVVNLYAVQRSVDAKGGCYTVEQLTLGGALGEPTAQRLTRGCDYPIDQPLLIPTLRYCDAHPRPAERQRFFDQILLDQPVAEQYEGRFCAIVIKLADKRGEDLLHQERPVIARAMRAIAQ